MFKKLALIFLSSLLFLNSMMVPLSALAADEEPSTWYNQGFADWYSKVYGDESPPSEIFGERYTAAQVQWILYSLISFPINFLGSKVQAVTACAFAAGSRGINIVEDIKCAEAIASIIQDASKIIGIATTSQIQTTPNLSFIDSVTYDYNNRPLSGIKYVAQSINQFISVPEANAQGFGFTAVDGLKKYWQGFRDISYGITVLIVIIFSFMIMFRVKLSPQLVISVQSALPKIFTALILATFSYAIAGFVIDLSYVVGGLFASLMNLAGFSSSFNEAFNFIVPIELQSSFGNFYILGYMVLYTILFFVTAVITLASTLTGLSVFGTIGSLLAILMSIWVLALMLWYSIKVPWILIKNLISLLISIVVGPVQIMVGALVPAIGFGTWFKKILAEALVFPLTGLFIFLSLKTLYASMSISLGQAGVNLSGLGFSFGTPPGNLWTPPLIGGVEDLAPLIWLAVSFVFITMIPKSVDILKMLIMGAKFDFGTAMGEATTPISTIGLPAAQYGITSSEKGAQKAVPKGGQYIPDWRINALKTLSGGKLK